VLLLRRLGDLGSRPRFEAPRLQASPFSSPLLSEDDGEFPALDANGEIATTSAITYVLVTLGLGPGLRRRDCRHGADATERSRFGRWSSDYDEDYMDEYEQQLATYDSLYQPMQLPLPPSPPPPPWVSAPV
jgi:hypothetical protein